MTLSISVLGITGLIEQSNLLNNSGFENDLNDWTLYPVSGEGINIVSTPVFKGTKTLSYGLTSWTFIYKLNIPVIIGNLYQFGCWTKTNQTNNKAYYYVKNAVPETKIPFSTSTNFIKNSYSFIPTSGLLECGIGIDADPSDALIYVDELFLIKL